MVSEQTLPADVVLLLAGSAPSPATPAAEGEEPPAPDTYAVDIEVQVAVAAQDVAGAALVAGPTAVSGDVVSTIRANEDLASTVSTVSGIEAEPGRINVPLALAARLADQVGQFGFEESATAVLPPAVELPPVTRTTASPRARRTPRRATPRAPRPVPGPTSSRPTPARGGLTWGARCARSRPPASPRR